jgi:hypothetical protein
MFIWDDNNFIESKSKQIILINSKSLKYWMIKLKKKLKIFYQKNKKFKDRI